MNNAQRLTLALTGKAVDRPPIASLMTGVTLGMMENTGINWPEAHQSAESMVELAAASAKLFGIETMKLPFCMTVEAEALGSAIDFGSRTTLPQVSKHIFQSYEDLVPPAGFLSQGRIPMVLEAIKLAKERYNGKIAVVASIVGPFTLAGKLFDFQELLMDLLLRPDEVKAVLEKLTDLCVCYAKAQQDAGCDVIQIGEASCSGDLLSPKLYQEFILPCHKKLAAALSVPAVVHICGNCGGHLPFIAETGFQGFSFDYRTDIRECHRFLDGKLALAGYLDPLRVFWNGTPEEVRRETAACVRSGVHVLNVGCAWPVTVPDENIEAFVSGAFDAFAEGAAHESTPGSC